MSKVRKDKCSFKVKEPSRSMYFFYKKDDWGSYWYLNRFRLFFIVDGVVCCKNDHDGRLSPFDKQVQDAFQVYLVEKILLGE